MPLHPLSEMSAGLYYRNVMSGIYWHLVVVVITTAQLYSTKLEFMFCAGSNPARDAEDL